MKIINVIDFLQLSFSKLYIQIVALAIICILKPSRCLVCCVKIITIFNSQSNYFVDELQEGFNIGDAPEIWSGTLGHEKTRLW